MPEPDPDATPAVTIYDVARAAGVAPSTVSRAFSRPGRVNAETGERIRQIAAQLGYRARPQARATSPTRSSMLAVVLADLANPVFYELVRGAGSACEAAGYTMMLAETAESAVRERATLERALESVDGLVLTASRISDSAIRQVAKVKPVVVVNRVVPGVPSVVIDVERGTFRSVQHLVELGHETVTYLSGPEASWADGMRWRGLRRAAEELGVRIRRTGPFAPTVNGGVQAAATWAQHRSSAVVAYNDLVAIGFIRGAGRLGVSVPGEVSVVGFDNSAMAELVSPELTTVAAPLHALGRTAAQNVLAMVGGARSQAPEPMQLPTRLVVRETTAPVAG
ncbi:LacI family DNA-binding transcriptional regulator [Ruania albidiflava]|uniref:LacI family DNA-binding transcriptional regulator n=1 Tax=Ruania albidiflava TaxID=366586 RepID=UPI0003B483E7|nr:LacI family DNA-binding transcriptional regulator [Ruania albidiflava]